MWVRPVLMMRSKARALAASATRRRSSAGSRARSIATAAEMCSTVGITSLLLWPRLTWSLGCTLTPASALARWAITSLAFMLVLVPLPVWNTSIGNSASHLAAATSPAALMIAWARPESRSPSSRFTAAACALSAPSAWMNSAGIGRPEIGKFSTARWVDAP